jgi:hypothetical protein
MRSIWVLYGVRRRTHLILLSVREAVRQGVLESTGTCQPELFSLDDGSQSRLWLQKLTRFRYAVGAMKFAGVHQGDWHLDQVMPQNANDTAQSSIIISGRQMISMSDGSATNALPRKRGKFAGHFISPSYPLSKRSAPGPTTSNTQVMK